MIKAQVRRVRVLRGKHLGQGQFAVGAADSSTDVEVSGPRQERLTDVALVAVRLLSHLQDFGQ